jgi:DNA-binding transcriptional ArsR family regulator
LARAGFTFNQAWPLVSKAEGYIGELCSEKGRKWVENSVWASALRWEAEHPISLDPSEIDPETTEALNNYAAVINLLAREGRFRGRTGPSDYLVAMALHRHALRLGTVWHIQASQRYLSERTGLRHQTVGNALKRLTASGLVQNARPGGIVTTTEEDEHEHVNVRVEKCIGTLWNLRVPPGVLDRTKSGYTSVGLGPEATCIGAAGDVGGTPVPWDAFVGKLLLREDGRLHDAARRGAMGGNGQAVIATLKDLGKGTTTEIAEAAGVSPRTAKLYLLRGEGTWFVLEGDEWQFNEPTEEQLQAFAERRGTAKGTNKAVARHVSEREDAIQNKTDRYPELLRRRTERIAQAMAEQPRCGAITRKCPRDGAKIPPGGQCPKCGEPVGQQCTWSVEVEGDRCPHHLYRCPQCAIKVPNRTTNCLKCGHATGWWLCTCEADQWVAPLSTGCKGCGRRPPSVPTSVPAPHPGVADDEAGVRTTAITTPSPEDFRAENEGQGPEPPDVRAEEAPCERIETAGTNFASSPRSNDEEPASDAGRPLTFMDAFPDDVLISSPDDAVKTCITSSPNLRPPDQARSRSVDRRCACGELLDVWDTVCALCDPVVEPLVGTQPENGRHFELVRMPITEAVFDQAA